MASTWTCFHIHEDDRAEAVAGTNSVSIQPEGHGRASASLFFRTYTQAAMVAAVVNRDFAELRRLLALMDEPAPAEQPEGAA